MAKIQPVEFPLNLGTANELQYFLASNSNNNGAMLTYVLLDDTIIPNKRLSRGYIILSEEEFTTHGTEKGWVLNHIANHLGVILI